MRIFEIIFLVVLIGGSVNSALGAKTTCDAMAAHPDDPDRTVHGLEREEINLEEAEVECRKELQQYPRHARTNYQLGRVIYYQGRELEAMPFLEAAASTGYRQAIFVMGYIHTTGKPMAVDYCKAIVWWLQSAALDHPWSGYHIVRATLDGQFDSCGVSFTQSELARFAQIASNTITVAASAGRVEKLLEDLNSYNTTLEN
jgi:TPR repeat protein